MFVDETDNYESEQNAQDETIENTESKEQTANNGDEQINEFSSGLLEQLNDTATEKITTSEETQPIRGYTQSGIEQDKKTQASQPPYDAIDMLIASKTTRNCDKKTSSNPISTEKPKRKSKEIAKRIKRKVSEQEHLQKEKSAFSWLIQPKKEKQRGKKK